MKNNNSLTCVTISIRKAEHILTPDQLIQDNVNVYPLEKSLMWEFLFMLVAEKLNDVYWEVGGKYFL